MNSDRIKISANITHQLKTPLHSISGYSELIANGMATGDDARKFGFRIYLEAQRTLRMVDEIIAVSRLDDPYELFEEEDVNICDMAAGAVTTFRNMAEMKGVELELETQTSGNDMGIISASSRLVRAIMENLVDNALKFTEPGGTIRVHVEAGENAVPVFAVKDTGIGISADEQEKVFQRFYRVDQSGSLKSGGTGLGLSIVEGAARRLGAEIELNSTLGKGTEVKITFSGR